MNTVGIFGSHPEDQYRSRELDRYLDSQEWSTDDIDEAKEALYDDITWNGAEWDENLVSYRMDMFIEWENIMTSRMDRSEKLAVMSDVQDRYVKLYCNEVVDQDPDAYCEKYCERF